jgi:hypothetical protein
MSLTSRKRPNIFYFANNSHKYLIKADRRNIIIESCQKATLCDLNVTLFESSLILCKRNAVK